MPQIIPGYQVLSEEHKAAIAKASNEEVTRHLAMATMFGDVETCTYITARHFDKLPVEVQEALKADGLKAISDITQDLLDGKLDNPEAAKKDLMDKTDAAIAKAFSQPASNTVH